MAKEELKQQDLDELISDYMKLIVRLAKSFNPQNEEQLDEYVQIGRIGCWEAFLNHDPSKGKFITWAWKRIRWEIIRHIKANKKHVDTIAKYAQHLNKDTCYNSPSLDWEMYPSNLTDTEIRILDMHKSGFTFKEIGQELGGFSHAWSFKVHKSALQKIAESNNATKEENTLG